MPRCRTRATEGHPCLTALRRPWLRADRRRLAQTSLSRQPATTLGRPRSPAAGHRGGAVSVVGNEARRVDADSSGARDGVARLSDRPTPGCRAVVKRGTRLGHPSGRPATSRNFTALSPLGSDRSSFFHRAFDGIADEDQRQAAENHLDTEQYTDSPGSGKRKLPPYQNAEQQRDDSVE